MNTTHRIQNGLLTITSRLAKVSLCAGLMLLPLASRAADVDIYSGLTGAAGVPNVLFVFDNAANFSSNAAAGAGTCNITGNTDFNPANPLNGTANTLAGTVGGIEQCAFYKVLRALPVNADGSARVNVGFMVYNSNNIADYQGLNCQGANGGCLVYPLTAMSGATRLSLLSYITTWRTAGGAGAGYIKAAGEATAATMQEAWAYYSGKIGLSGRSYAGIQPPAGCQKNFVIFLGNSYSSAGSPGDGGTVSPAAALTTAYGATPIPTPMPILGSLSTSCGVYSFPSATATHENGGFYADEWARFMYTTDIFAGSTGTQNIVTYTIGVLGATCQASYAALLTSMAGYGGGKYFATSDDNSIVQALLNILNEVQSVNSVFSAATLPVSVNTQGTYLNQIYMGMFRPDPNGNPRWVGNVKQFQFQFDANSNLYLADATGQPAISSGGTGFIAPYAASFWSCTNPTRAAALTGPASLPAPAPPYVQYSALPTCALDPTPGFWANYQSYVSTTYGGAFDMQDGEVVEKGGAGQQLRLSNLTDNYTTSPAGPRNVYTYCPQDPDNLLGTCVGDLTNAANSFATTNANITATMFGTGLTVTITSLTRVGTTATATTSASHGLLPGNTVTIVGATPNDYNGLVTVVTVPASNKFTYTIVEYPPSPATTITTTGGAGGYTASLPSALAIPLASLSRTAAGTAATATVTAVDSAANGYTTGILVTIAGATPSNYNLTQAVTVVNATTFTYPISVNPTPTPVGTYTVDLSTNTNIPISTASCNTATKVVLVTTPGHTFRTGDMVIISGDTQTPASKQMNGTYFSITVPTGSTTQFSYVAPSCPGAPVGATVNAGPAAPAPVTLTRNETAVGTATVSAQVGTGMQFANGDTVNIVYTGAAGTQPANETGYLVSSATITCATNPCGTTFTYTIATTPGAQPSGPITSAAALPAQTISSLTRVTPGGTTATAVLAAGSAGFLNGATVAIQTAPGTTLAAHEGAYTGNWVITCSPAVAVGTNCTSFTYGPLVLSPASPASGAIFATNPGAAPNRTTLINWVRGEDNFGDEASLCPPGAVAGTAPCPNPAVTVRPSVHGDVLHSRPIAVNYGGTTGVVVYYGTNDGVYHAINGNQTANIGTVQPGGELWGFVAADFYGKLNRQRSNLPVLLMPSTPPGILPTPQPKDYFIDGPTGLYQKVDPVTHVILQAIIYIGTRRGGHFFYAVDVTNPLLPKVLWKKSNGSPGFTELGQTWSLPKVAYVKGYCGGTACSATNPPSPVLLFGAGYDDGGEDTEPPLADFQGRGIFVLDAITGNLIWSASPAATGAATDYYWHRTATYAGSVCTGTTIQTNCQVDGMKYSIPADLTLVDRDHDGLVDRLYATDTGGNIWRVDLEPAAGATPNFWQVTQLAALGCATGPCGLNGAAATAPGTAPGTPRKFFFRIEIINNVSTNVPPYDAVFIGSGDREHPLYTQQAYKVTNRVYMIKDFNIGKDSVSQLLPISEANLDDCTGTAANPNTCSTITTGAASPLPYNQLTTDPSAAASQQHSGYYVALGIGEKVVNAPLAVAGSVYFGTNQPTVPSATSCSTNLGIARGYMLDPFGAAYSSSVYDGGGLPPSPVSGVVIIGNREALFCVGCGGNPANSSTVDSHSSVGSSKLKPKISSTRHRSYWFIEGK